MKKIFMSAPANYLEVENGSYVHNTNENWVNSFKTKLFPIRFKSMTQYVIR